MDITPYLKDKKNIVLELDDEVEYLLSPDAVEAIKKEEKRIKLVTLYDRVEMNIELERIEYAIQNGGIVDYLDQK